MTCFELVKWRDLSAADRDAWRAFRAASPGLRSPYFDLGWFDALASVRGDLQVIRGKGRHGPTAFLPFHARPLGAEPAGGPFSDWHGFVAEPGTPLDARAALAAGTPNYRFNAAPASDPGFAPLAEARDHSHLMDLTGGFELYAKPKGGSAPKAARNWRRGFRKMEEDGREPRFVLDEHDPEVLTQLLAIKSDQFRRTGHPDRLAYGWSRALMRAVFDSRVDAFTGLLSALYIDGELAAAHLGMRSGGVLHYWMPVFETRFSAYAPGVVLMAEMAREGAAAGVVEIDLGPGDYQHKKELANAGAPLIAGVAHAASLVGGASRLAYGAGRRWSALPLGAAAALPHRISRRLERALEARAPAPVS
jgi:CelD/BcsL family acetyltransferase involved in cellulose biosynthesis